MSAAAEIIAAATKPLIIAGGGVHYSEAEQALAAFCEQTGIPVAESQAGKGSLRFDHPQSVGAVGSTGTTAANALAAEADVIIGIGTRYSDFTTASRTASARSSGRTTRPPRSSASCRRSCSCRPRSSARSVRRSPVSTSSRTSC